MLKISIQEAQNFVVYERFKKKNDIFTSVQYKKAKKSVDYFVAFGNGKIGKILFYFFKEKKPYAMINEFLETGKIGHLQEIQNTNEMVVVPVDDIEKKYVHMKVQTRQYVTFLPNSFERD